MKRSPFTKQATQLGIPSFDFGISIEGYRAMNSQDRNQKPMNAPKGAPGETPMNGPEASSEEKELNIPEGSPPNTPKYLRKNNWCRCECSCNAASGGLEKGLSAFECMQVDTGCWRGTGKAYDKHLKAKVGQTIGTWYLVTGTPLESKGGDEEPLLQGVIPLKVVVWDTKKNCFEENGSAQDFQHENHPEYPSCKCESIDDILKKMLEEDEGDEEYE